MKNLSQSEWKRLYKNQDDAIILDVRTEYEYLDGNIPKSVNIDILNPQQFMSEIDKFKVSGSTSTNLGFNPA